MLVLGALASLAASGCGLGLGGGATDAGHPGVDGGATDAGPTTAQDAGTPDAGSSHCGPANCGGCCSAAGSCIARPYSGNNTTCGASGNTCQDCTLTSMVCNANTGTCTSAQPPQICDGCLVGSGTCVTLANTSVINCGVGGSICVGCAMGQTCTAGECVSPDAGASGGRIGDACTADLDCSRIPGGKAYCKKQQLGGSLPYQGGYCTKYCTMQSDCGTGAHCAYWLGPTGEAEPLCYKDCTSSSCRAGYTCSDVGFTSAPYLSCLPATADGGLGEYDAGPGNPGAAGAACLSDSQCGPVSNFLCVAEHPADGGTNPFPGGMCTGDCSMSVNDAWCGTGGICLPYLPGASTKYGSLVMWECLAGCDPTVGTNTCRTGYICDPLDPTDPTYKYGTCTPDCRTTPATCRGSTPICDNTNGRCK